MSDSTPDAIDLRTEIPPEELLPYRYRRKLPYIYTDAEISKLISAAKKLSSPRGLRGPTLSTLFGLLAATGMRASEPINLDCKDVDLRNGILTIHQTKFDKSRLVPVHITTKNKLRFLTMKKLLGASLMFIGAVVSTL